VSALISYDTPATVSVAAWRGAGVTSAFVSIEVFVRAAAEVVDVVVADRDGAITRVCDPNPSAPVKASIDAVMNEIKEVIKTKNSARSRDS